MADKKISALTGATTPLDGTEVLPIVQSGATVKVANNDLRPKQIQSNATSGVLQVAGPASAATRVMTTPDANFTVARTDAAQTFTGVQTLSSNALINGLTVGLGASNIAGNTVAGVSALATNATGANNVAVGYQALNLLTSTNGNTALGYWAGLNSTGTNNIFIGNLGGYTATTGGSNIFIGYNANPSAAGDDGELVIGGNATGKGSNTGFIVANGNIYQGNNSTLWAITSDQRLKKNIVDNTDGLNKITAIQVRNFEYRLPEEVTELALHNAIKQEGVQLGVIAQELQQILPDCVKSESTGVMSVDASNLTWYMINAIKQQQVLIEALTARLSALE